MGTMMELPKVRLLVQLLGKNLEILKGLELVLPRTQKRHQRTLKF